MKLPQQSRMQSFQYNVLHMSTNLDALGMRIVSMRKTM